LQNGRRTQSTKVDAGTAKYEKGNKKGAEGNGYALDNLRREAYETGGKGEGEWKVTP